MSDDNNEPAAEPAFEEDVTPHAKQNMTSPFGRLVERITYLDVVLGAHGLAKITCRCFRHRLGGIGAEGARQLDGWIGVGRLHDPVG